MNSCDIKLNIFSRLHRIINRAFHQEDAMEGLIEVLSEALPLSTVAIAIGGAKARFFVSPSSDANVNAEQRIRSLYKNISFRKPQPFLILRGDPAPLFLDPMALHSTRKEEVNLVGSPVILDGEIVGAVMADRLFGNRIPLIEDVQFLSMLAGFVAQIVSLELQVKRREDELTRENLALKTRISEEHLGVVCVGESRAASKLEDEIRKAARADAPVLLWGEPGTGKRSLARIIHQLSARASFQFVITNCSLPEDLLEKELFGMKGHALNDIEESTLLSKASGGTLLLDEVNELSIPHQIRLLDALDQMQAGSFAALWNNGFNARLVSTASLDLSEAAAAGSFRKDLLGRLGTLLIYVPCIRERKEDIGSLVMHFLANACAEQGRRVSLDARGLKMLCAYDWPGNMAEMKNTMIRLVIMADGDEIRWGDIESVIAPKSMGKTVGRESNVIYAPSRLDQIERREVSAALERNRWIRTKAAKDLGLTVRQMNYRVKKFGLDGLVRQNRSRTHTS